MENVPKRKIIFKDSFWNLSRSSLRWKWAFWKIEIWKIVYVCVARRNFYKGKEVIVFNSKDYGIPKIYLKVIMGKIWVRKLKELIQKLKISNWNLKISEVCLEIKIFLVINSIFEPTLVTFVKTKFSPWIIFAFSI